MNFIILNGSSCSGKSTIVKNILEKSDRLFYLSFDRIKWLFSKYSSVDHGDDVGEVLLSVANKICEMKYGVICDSGLHKSWRDKLINIVTLHNYKIIEINLEADYEVLAQRFDERVAKALATPEKDRRISNISVERFKELYDIFQKEKNPSAITFRTDTQSDEEIAENIIKLF